METKQLIRVEANENGEIIIEAKHLEDVELSLLISLLFAELRKSYEMTDQHFDQLLKFTMENAKLRTESLKTVFIMYTKMGLKEALNKKAEEEVAAKGNVQ